MSVKYVKEDRDEKIIKQCMCPTTLPDYLQRIAVAICSEHAAVTEYDSLIASEDIPEGVKSVIYEIRNDELDHAVQLSALLQRYTESTLPENTDELNDVPDPEDDQEILYDNDGEDIVDLEPMDVDDEEEIL